MLVAALGVALAGLIAARRTPIDALPDLSDVQTIVVTSWPGQAPQTVEDQVTRPLSSRLRGVAGARTVRGFSSFGLSFVYVLFADGTDGYWARARVLELLSSAASELPPGARAELGPDATGVGWAFAYALRSKTRSLEDLRGLQDWTLRPALAAVPGVAEIASVGGFEREYLVEVDPLRLAALNLALADVVAAVRDASGEAGGGAIEAGGAEHMVRVRGWVGDVADLEAAPVMAGAGAEDGGGMAGGAGQETLYRLRDVARVALAPAPRRGIADWNGAGEVVGGIVLVRSGADVRSAIEGARARLASLAAELPDVEFLVAYDRSRLIDEALGTLVRTLGEQGLIVLLVCIAFLAHLRSALVAIVSIPVALAASFIAMRVLDVGANLMSLGGLAISVGVLVDSSIVLVENAHRRIGTAPAGAARLPLLRAAAAEVSPTLFFALLVVTVSFLPVFAFEGPEGRLVRPLAMTKTCALLAGSVVAVTLAPALLAWCVRGRIRGEDELVFSRVPRRVYGPLLRAALAHPVATLVLASALVLSSLWPIARARGEFLPPLWEGDLLYMPTTLPGIAPEAARDLLQRTDAILAGFPEVESVFGKVGRAETATDPAPLSMIETTLRLKDPAQWRPGMTRERLIDELDRALAIPGLVNSWTMPVKARLDMLATGIKTPLGVKLSGADVASVQQAALTVEAALRGLPGARSVVADRSSEGRYLEVDIDREKAGERGLSVRMIQECVATAIGGEPVAWTVEGRRRTAIAVRYARELRDDARDLAAMLVRSPDGVDVPLGDVARIELVRGPDEIRSEDARIQAWVFVDVREDLAGFVARAKEALARSAVLPAGVELAWSGRYEEEQRLKSRLAEVLPLVGAAIVFLLVASTRSLAKTGIVLCVVPLSVAGAAWLMYALGYGWSLASWVGAIALAGLDAEMGAVMLLYLDLAWERRAAAGALATRADELAAVEEGAAARLRPKLMTVATTWCGLLPIFWIDGAGADVMRRLAAPMVGGLLTSFVGELCVCPVLYLTWRRWRARRTAAEVLDAV